MQKRPTLAIIDRSAIRHNYLKVQKRITNGTGILAIIKSNAYGHGAIEIAKTLDTCGCDIFGVAFCEEGIELREAGIGGTIVVLSGVFSNQLEEMIHYNLTPVIFDLDIAVSLNDAAKKMNCIANIHVKIDTGMGRLGLLHHDIVPFFNGIRGMKNLHVAGVLSHFSDVDEEDKSYATQQMKNFESAVITIKELGFNPRFVHMANSAAIVDYPSAYFNLVRPGIMLYGAYPKTRLNGMIDIKPALTLKTRIMLLKWLPKGASVSYGRRYIARKDTLVATVPIGYGDGYPRCLSDKGEMLVRNSKVRVIGTVCMDLTMLDVSAIEGVSIGDEVIVLGSQGDKQITADEVAEKAGTIPYELFCGISARVSRVYV